MEKRTLSLSLGILCVRLSHYVRVLSGRVTRRSLIVINDWLPPHVPSFFVCVEKARLGRLEKSERPPLVLLPRRESTDRSI
jgi:hypothetical protein